MSRSQRFFALPGVSLPAISMPGGSIRGVEIDNSSGSWLFIPSFETYIPPFTIGWSMDFPYAASSIDIIAGNPGPVGQSSTAQGNGVTVFLNNENVGSNAGGPDPSAPTQGTQAGTGTEVIGLSIEPSFQAQTDSVPIAGVSILEVDPGPTKRVRVYSLRASYDPTSGNYQISPISVAWQDDFGGIVGQDTLMPNAPKAQFDYLNGFDLPVGSTLTVFMLSRWATVDILHSVAYRIV